MTAPSESLLLLGKSALVVEPDESDRAFIVSTLASAGLRVGEVDGFTDARAQLVRHPPALLVTEIRLGLHNGLHLAHLARWRRPQMLVVVTSRYRDPVLIRDAEALGVTFVQKPFTSEDLLATFSGRVR